MTAYQEFLARKAIVDAPTGIENPNNISKSLFPFQSAVVKWALQRGRAAIFAGTGLGKTPMQCEWAKHVNAHTNLPVLILAPLAVSHQTIDEARKILGMGIEYAEYAGDIQEGVYITNYQKLDRFDGVEFGGIALDESSIIKSVDGKTKAKLLERFADTPFRLACTATPAPNDYMELGNHAEFLGVMSSVEMLSTFFVHDGGETQKWRLKGHAEKDFWKWMASWSACFTHPRDLGFNQDGYDLPALRIHEVIVDCESKPLPGDLFALPASTLDGRRSARRASIDMRVKMAFDIIKCIVQPISANIGKSTWLKSEPTTTNGISKTQNIAEGSQGKGEQTILKRSRSGKTNTEKKTETNSTPTCERDTNSSELNLSPKANSEERLIQRLSETGILSDITELPSLNSTKCLKSSKADVQFVNENLKQNSDSIIATSQSKLGDCYAIAATLESENSMTMENGSSEQPNTLEKWVVWCGLNNEQDSISESLGQDLCVSIQGSTSDEDKVKLEHEWRTESVPVLITKPSVFGHGLNWQHSHKAIFLGLNDSFETLFQAVRRQYRFGQTKPVDVYIILSSLEGEVLKNIKRKEADAIAMQKALVEHMAELTRKQLGTAGARTKLEYHTTLKCKLPHFLNLK